MTKGRNLLLAPVLLGAYWMATSRSGRSRWGQLRQGRSWRGGLGQSLVQGLFGRSGLLRSIVGRGGIGRSLMGRSMVPRLLR
jgi:hypothetical protein